MGTPAEIVRQDHSQQLEGHSLFHCGTVYDNGRARDVGVLLRKDDVHAWSLYFVRIDFHEVSGRPGLSLLCSHLETAIMHVSMTHISPIRCCHPHISRYHSTSQSH